MTIHSGSGEGLSDNSGDKPLRRTRLRKLGAPAVMLAVTAVIAAFPESASQPNTDKPTIKALIGSIHRQRIISDRLFGQSCTLRRSAPNLDQTEINGLRQDALNPVAVLRAHRRIADPQTTRALSMAAKFRVFPIRGDERPPLPSEFGNDYDITLQSSYRRAIGRHITTANDDYAQLRALTEGDVSPGIDLFWQGLDNGFHPEADFQHMTADIDFVAGCQDQYQHIKAVLSN